MPTIIEITDLRAGTGRVYTFDRSAAAQQAGTGKGIFIAESPQRSSAPRWTRAVCRFPFNGAPPHRRFGRRRAGPLPRYPRVHRPRETLQTLTGYARGVLCAMRRPKQHTVEELCQTARRVAVLEGSQQRPFRYHCNAAPHLF